jgi:hypothetical protein
VLEVSTKVSDPKPFLLDGEKYHLLGLEHLSREVEAEVVALFAQYGRLSMRLEIEKKRETSKKIVEKMQVLREELLGALTDVPADVLAKLPVGAQVKILEALQSLVEGADADEDLEEEPKLDGASSDGDDEL